MGLEGGSSDAAGGRGGIDGGHNADGEDTGLVAGSVGDDDGEVDGDGAVLLVLRRDAD
jgi:hypothetical protein